MAAMGDGYRALMLLFFFFASIPTIEVMPLSGNSNNA